MVSCARAAVLAAADEADSFFVADDEPRVFADGGVDAAGLLAGFGGVVAGGVEVDGGVEAGGGSGGAAGDGADRVAAGDGDGDGEDGVAEVDDGVDGDDGVEEVDDGPGGAAEAGVLGPTAIAATVTAAKAIGRTRRRRGPMSGAFPLQQARVKFAARAAFLAISKPLGRAARTCRADLPRGPAVRACRAGRPSAQRFNQIVFVGSRCADVGACAPGASMNSSPSAGLASVEAVAAVVDEGAEGARAEAGAADGLPPRSVSSPSPPGSAGSRATSKPTGTW